MGRSPAETPLMRQYLEVKEQHPDGLVLFRCGDFYETFFEDAVEASRLLDLTLTSRDKGKEGAVPMAGVPYHAVRGYIARLTEHGKKVVMVEQVEDPKLAKGLVKREVVRIITPGIVLDDDVLDPKRARYVMAIVPPSARDKDAVVGIAYLDATTGELHATVLDAASAIDELVRVAPREVVVAADLHAALSADPVPPRAALLAHLRARYKCPFNPASSSCFGDDSAARTELGALVVIEPSIPLRQRELAIRAAAAVVAYGRATQPTGTLPINKLVLYQPDDAVVLDETAIANLELTETLIGKHKQGSLLDVIDGTVTAPGGRMLRRWLLYPLRDIEKIRRRQDAVGWFVERPALLSDARAALAQIADLERLAGKATLGVAQPRDLARLRDALGRLPALQKLIASSKTKMSPLPEVLDLAPCAHVSLPRLHTRLMEAIVDEPPPVMDHHKGTGIIRTGYDNQVDECRRLADGGKDEILAIEEREQKRSGISSLKVRYNRVFGYYIEITKSQLTKVPADYIRKQTIANGERYVTTQLAELEKKVLTAEETLLAREAELFKAEVAAVATVAREIAAAGAALATLDACASLAEVAARRGYCRPLVDDGAALELTEGRHPVIEAMLPTNTFVPNDCRLESGAEQLVLITGPNMAGKSTYMRQVAHIVLLAQIGSFVPAKAARIGVCDRVFTRVGASDNLSRGDSTFMVEMRETAAILAKATARSLIILDEVGRGTSTFDGVAIAWAVAEHLHDKTRARTLFATHYHELVALADSRPHVRNVSVAVREHKGEIVFLRQVVPGGANKSYGIDVARLAGLPTSVVSRARQIMGQLEGTSLAPSPQLALSIIAPQAPTPGALVQKLESIDINDTTPMQALQLLADLKKLL